MDDHCDSNINFDLSGYEESLASLSPEECKLVIHGFNEKEDFLPPQAGMLFSSEDEVRLYYKKYAIREGFRFLTRSSKKGHDGRVKYLTFACSGEGFRRACKGMRTSSLGKQKCKAKICVSLCKDSNYWILTAMLNHNHKLLPHQVLKNLSGRAKRTSDRKGIDMHAKRTTDQKGIGTHVKIEADQNDWGNYVHKARHLVGSNGDGEALQKYLVRMQEQDGNFFHAIDLDDSFHVRNIFWADGRSRAMYESFGDLVIVDTTYLCNHYRMPLATFVGLNHHGQSVLFGCGLLSCEDSESFIWLFQSWLCCMSGVPPQGIITDHCKVMQEAVEIVFPSTRHRWCLLCIMKKVPQKIHGYANSESLRDLLHDVVYDTPTTNEFESNWKKMVHKYGLESNNWLKELFQERHRWVPTFIRGSFWAGVSINPRSESMPSFFDGYVNRQTTLKQFVDQYDNALQDMAEKEFVADIHSSCNTRTCVTKSQLERQFQSAYTYTKFLEIQDEFLGKADCNVSVIHDYGSICHYNVIEDVLIGDNPKETVVEVTFNRINCNVNCSCCLFEFKGILCRHSLAILAKERVKEAPSKYILDRWRKDIERKYVFTKTSYGVQHHKPKMQRLELLCKQFKSVADVAAEFEETSCFVKDTVCNMKEKIQAWASHLRNSSQDKA